MCLRDSDKGRRLHLHAADSQIVALQSGFRFELCGDFLFRLADRFLYSFRIWAAVTQIAAERFDNMLSEAGFIFRGLRTELCYLMKRSEGQCHYLIQGIEHSKIPGVGGRSQLRIAR